MKLSRWVYETVNAVNACQTRQQLRDIHRTVERMLASNAITDQEAMFLEMQMQIRETPRKDLNPRKVFISRLFGFRQRPYQVSPDRKKSRERRRTLAGSSSLPPEIRGAYTEGQRAVLTVVTEEVKRHGHCDVAIDAIAARAGVCRTTVQNALSEARRRGDVSIRIREQRGKKNLTNLIRVISKEWQAWIRRGIEVARVIGSKTANYVNPTEINLFNNPEKRTACGQTYAKKRGWPDPDSPKTLLMLPQRRKEWVYA